MANGKLSTDGISLNATTILSIIARLEPAVLAIPEVVDLVKAAISVFSQEDKGKVEDAYQAKMAQTDKAHEDTQHVLQEEAATVPGSGEVDASPKGGGE
jgi:uncharacterized protein YukE